MTSYFGTTLFLPNIPWNVAFPIAIWTARNKFVMENKAFVTSKNLKKIQALSIAIFFSLLIKERKPHCGSVHISWNPPPRGFFKLNIDGLVNGNQGKANTGRLIRNSMGDWVGGLSKHIGITHSMVPELWGLHDGLILAKNLSLRKLIIALDTILTSHDALYDSSHPCSALISDCRSLLQSFEETHIHHIFNEGNKCADLLAKEGPLGSDSFILYSHPFFPIMYLLFSDAISNSYLGLCIL